VDPRLGAAEEAGADLHRARPEGQRRRDAARIGDAARRDHRHGKGIGKARDQGEATGQLRPTVQMLLWQCLTP